MRFTVARRPIGRSVSSLGKRLRDVFRILFDSRLAHAHRRACTAGQGEFVTYSSVRRRALLDDNQRGAQFAAHHGFDAVTGPEETALDGTMLADWRRLARLGLHRASIQAAYTCRALRNHTTIQQSDRHDIFLRCDAGTDPRPMGVED